MPRQNKRFITSPQGGEHGVTTELVTVALLSAQPGHRMKSYGPTPLLQLGNETLLDRQISSIQSVFGNYEIILCVGFGSERIVKFVKEKYHKINIRVVENQVHHHSNCCESARLGLNNTTNTRILLCNGDLVIERDLLSKLKTNRSYIVVEEKGSPNLEVGATINVSGNVENLCYGLDTAWSEIMFLEGAETIEEFRKIISTPDYKTKFIFEALNELGKTKHKLTHVVNEQAPLTKIDNIKTYHEVRRQYEATHTKLRNK